MPSHSLPFTSLPSDALQSWRDDFERNITALQIRISLLLGIPSFTFHAYPLDLYPYAKPGFMDTQKNFGKVVFSYFEFFVHAVSKYTENGVNYEAKACFVDAIHTHSAAISASDNVAYTSMSIEEGQVMLLFNPTRFGSNITHIADDLARVVDVALGASNTSLISRWSSVAGTGSSGSIGVTANSGRPTIVELTAKMGKLLGEPYTFEFDAASILKAVSADSSNPRPDWSADLPRFVNWYFDAAVKTLEEQGIKDDEMVREAFNLATGKRVIRLELVDKLQNNSVFHDNIFEEGEWKLQTTSRYFGCHMDTIAQYVLHRL